MKVQEIGEEIDKIAITTLVDLRDLFKKNKLDDRLATLSLHYYLTTFTRHGWKGYKPSEVLTECIAITKNVGEDKEIPLEVSE